MLTPTNVEFDDLVKKLGEIIKLVKSVFRQKKTARANRSGLKFSLYNQRRETES